MTLNDVWLTERANDLKTSMIFLTRLPSTRGIVVSGAAIGRAAWAFPITGALIGLIGVLVYALAHRLGLTFWPAAALAVAATMAVTGCLHEGGLADTVDGFGGGDTREQKLGIMRDSRIGTYGVCALALSIMLRAGVLASLADPGLVLAALVAAHSVARAFLPAFMFFVPPARNDGLSYEVGRPPRDSVAVAAGLGVVILVLCLGPLTALLALLLLVLLFALMGWLCLVQIDGQTGGVLGAIEQAAEILILLVALH